ncbi:hypothetical protein JCM2811A_28970 [Methylorubrum rhodinum]
MAGSPGLDTRYATKTLSGRRSDVPCIVGSVPFRRVGGVIWARVLNGPRGPRFRRAPGEASEGRRESASVSSRGAELRLAA